MAGESCLLLLGIGTKVWVISTTQGRFCLVAWPYACSSFDTRWILKSIRNMSPEISVLRWQQKYMPLPVKSDSVTGHFLLGSYEFRLSPPSRPLTCLLQIVVSIIALLPKSDFADHFTLGSSLPWVLLRLRQNKLPCSVTTRGFP